ncbi:hydrogenase expression/formation protein HypE [Streptoalloteichus hindustanus]|uniref:Hydrogenase maturation protein, carbamoyl dehydratase HypE n=1 Tax=Streptoalloteichus hindustanus TaxID=2017 RepID=A0A1M5DT04_STRHI|nr:hydrogenase expression/formation protein HypE [Streptoalloteichus hindustanus]SHF70117.1 Hydrogenase maturation protein, carbamoyl dehydratase HypE [Streptoalloteichus hindustanus]
MSTSALTTSCPTSQPETEHVRLGHGSGGQLMAELLREVIAPALGGAELVEDAAALDLGPARVVLTTDSFVVTPRFFPGGDIGALAVHGTINDLAMRGARPVALCLAYVLEEGLPIEELRRITTSVADASRAAGVPVVTGDTKVVERGGADGIYLTTTGLGVPTADADPSARGARPGDLVLLSGPIGLHGTAILSAREGLGFEAEIASDTRPLHRLVAAMLAAGGRGVHALRDPTRGGLASALTEIAAASAVGVELVEADLPVPPPVAAACDLLGLDPLQVANEGCLVAVVDPAVAPAVLDAMRARPEGASAVVVGRVVDDPAHRVRARTLVGSHRVVDVLVGEQLPRIC